VFAIAVDLGTTALAQKALPVPVGVGQTAWKADFAALAAPAELNSAIAALEPPRPRELSELALPDLAAASAALRSGFC
jgi:hypothetical protein